MKTRRSTFTLIELLVVIGIIGILAAMLMPALAKAREKGIATDCLNGIKQLSLGLVMYENDNALWFPEIPGGQNGVNRENQWIFYTGYPVPSAGVFIPSRGTLFPYVNSSALYLCKADKTIGQNSYSLNSNAGDCKITEVDNPTETLIVLEEGTRNSPSTIRTSNDGYFEASGDRCADRHTKGSNYGYMDGHATWEKMPDATLRDHLTF